MKIAFYGSSLLSSWWNGSAAYYRGLLRDLAGRGYEISFYEPDAFDRQQHRDIDPPAWAKSVVYPATAEGIRSVVDRAGDADVVIKASDVGVFDEELIDGLVQNARPDALRIFWDMDAAATLEKMRGDEAHPVRRNLRSLDLVFTSGGGRQVADDYAAMGSTASIPIYNALDPAAHHRVDPNPNYDADLSFFGNRLADRESRTDEYFFAAAKALPGRRFLVGGDGWETKSFPANVRQIGHLPRDDQNAFNSTPLALLSVARDSVANVGFSPPSRLFEAAGAAACLISDSWDGIGLFLRPETEILVARDGRDVAHYVDSLTPVVARAIGEAALRRILSEHTFSHRGAQVDALLTRELEIRRSAPSVAPSRVPA